MEGGGCGLFSFCRHPFFDLILALEEAAPVGGGRGDEALLGKEGEATPRDVGMNDDGSHRKRAAGGGKSFLGPPRPLGGDGDCGVPDALEGIRDACRKGGEGGGFSTLTLEISARKGREESFLLLLTAPSPLFPPFGVSIYVGGANVGPIYPRRPRGPPTPPPPPPLLQSLLHPRFSRAHAEEEEKEETADDSLSEGGW